MRKMGGRERSLIWDSNWDVGDKQIEGAATGETALGENWELGLKGGEL